MNQANPTIAETLFGQTTFTRNPSPEFEKYPMRFTKADFQGINTINNYLKSPEDIEAELSMELNNRKMAYMPVQGGDETYLPTMSYQDGQYNTYNPGYNPSGFMEENY